MSKLIEKLQAFKTRVQMGWETAYGRFNALSRREKKIFAAAAAMALICIVDFGVIRPLGRSLKDLDQEISSQEKKTLHNLRSLAQKQSISQAYEKIRANMEPVSHDDEEIRASFLKDVEKKAGEQGIYLSELRPQVSASNDSVTQFSVRLQAEGRMPEILKFLAALSEARKLYYVDNLRVTPHPEDINKVRAGITLSRIVFSEFQA